ncbi:unnamed protein product [Parajaminaea phylloscopi]
MSIASSRALVQPALRPAVAAHVRSLATQPQQAIKSTTDANGQQPANPSPPPRAAASTPQPGAHAFQQTSPKAPQVERRPAKPPAPSAYNEVTRKLVRGVAWMMGYSSRGSTAIRVTSDLYDRCASIWDVDAEFWQGECQLPPTYQSWFQVTNLHVILLLLRFRALEPASAKAYEQELVNHFFIDAETRMRQRFGVQTGRLVKGYMKEMHNQHRGALLALDECIAMVGADGQGDSRIAMAIWRNVFGAGWGDVGGVLSKIKGVDRDDPKKKGATAAAVEVDNGPQLAADQGPSTEVNEAASPYAKALAQQRRNALAQGKVISEATPRDTMAAENPELAFPIMLSRLTRYFLRELRRLAAISDHEVEVGRLSRAPGPADGRAPPAHISPENAASVGAGEAIERSQVRPLDLHVQAEQQRPDATDSQASEREASWEQGGQAAKSVASFGKP